MIQRAGDSRILIGLILLVAFGLRTGAACWWESRLTEGQQFAFGDSESYWVLAGQIARGEPYRFGHGQARIFRTPGYPILLAGLFRITDEPPVIWARMLGAVLGTVAVGGVIWLTRELFSIRAAIVAGIMATLYPGAIGMSVFVLSEAPFCPLMLVQIIAWIAAARCECPKRAAGFAFAAGAVAGVATLVRPSWLLFTPFALGIAFVLFGDRKRQLLIGVAMAIGLVLAMAPWWVRNYGITGKLTLTTTQFGASLYDGWRDDANGGSDMRYVENFYQQQLKADAADPASATGTFEERLDNRMRQAALDWARQHPRRVVQLAGIKFLRIWSPWPNSDTMQSWTYRLAILLGYTPLLILAVTGAIRFARRGWPYALCVVPAVYFTCLHTIFVGSIRYRQPAMLVLIVLAAGFVDAWWPVRVTHEEEESASSKS
ncbi:MAG: glycosyltransferase family 39 protein [Planctomycetota bacterium]|nr:glycosyltransferase family 39 protein [Planctomycetota bacterium]